MLEGSLVIDIFLGVEGIDMKQKIVALLIYVATALSFGEFIDALFGASPDVHYNLFLCITIASFLLFGAACILCLFSLRFGIISGCAAVIVALPNFYSNLHYIYESGLNFIVHNRPETLALTISLIVSAVYSIIGIIRLSHTKSREKNFTIASALIYTFTLVILANWQDIASWVSKVRYGG